MCGDEQPCVQCLLCWFECRALMSEFFVREKERGRSGENEYHSSFVQKILNHEENKEKIIPRAPLISRLIDEL